MTGTRPREVKASQQRGTRTHMQLTREVPILAPHSSLPESDRGVRVESIAVLFRSDGQICFQLTFIICAGVACVGVILALALQLLSRSTYSRMRQHRAAAAAATESETAPLLGESRGSGSGTA